MNRPTRRLSTVTVATLALMASCVDSSGPSQQRRVNQLPSLIVSSPESQPAGASVSRSPSRGANAAVVVATAWVSLPPASVPGGQSATILNARSGDSITVALVDGGFDPVAVTASVGDTLFVDVTLSGGGAAVTGFQVVAAGRAPLVVRVTPPPGKKDVPLNAQIVAVFSAPIDSATLSPTSFGLLRGSAPVAGSVRLSGPNGLSAEFYPDSPLEKFTSYQVFVSQAIQDVNGVPLAAPVTQSFSTDSTESTGSVSVANSTLSASPDSTWFDGNPVLITLTLRDSSNVQIAHGGATFLINSTAGFIQGVTDHADGTYTAILSPPATLGSARVSATVSGIQLPSTCTVRFVDQPLGPVNQVASGAKPEDSTVLADGASTTQVTVWLRDYYGHYISKPADSIILTTTLGSLGPVSGSGTYVATLTAPATTGTAVVTARFGSLTWSFPVRFGLQHLWARKAQMPGPFFNMAAASVNGTVYVAGGMYDWGDYGPDSVGHELYAYDAATNGWTQRANMPGDRSALAMASINGILYAVGGFDDGGRESNSLFAYDPAADHWKMLAPMPTARGGLAVAVVGGILYAVGGYEGANLLRTVEAYDPSTDSWTTKASIPTARFGLAAGVVNGILYAFGGYASPNPNNVVEAYDPAADSWTSKPSMPMGSNGLAAVALGARLYAVSADSGVAFQLYDPSTNSWSVQPPSPLSIYKSFYTQYNLIYGVIALPVNGSLFAVAGGGSSAIWVP